MIAAEGLPPAQRAAAIAAADRYFDDVTPPELDEKPEPDELTQLVFLAWRWLSRQRPPPAVGFGGAIHSCLPAYWIDYWLIRKAGLRDGEPFFRLLWHLLEVMDQMYLEHHNRRPDDKDQDDKDKGGAAQ